MKKIFALPTVLLILFFTTSVSQGWAQANGDFRTKNVTGNWSDFNSWERYNGGWGPASSGQVPTQTSAVTVMAGHTISVNNGSAVCKKLYVNGSTTSKIAFSVATSVLNIKDSMFLASSFHNCFGIWAAGAKMVFSGTVAQGFINLNAFSEFVNIEVIKGNSTLNIPISSNLRFGSITLTTGNFTVGSQSEIQGSSSNATITINGGTWSQINSTTKINNSGTPGSPIGALNINGGTMVLGTTSNTGGGGFQLSTINVSNSGTLTYQTSSGIFAISNSISVDATSSFNTAHSGLTFPGIVTFNGTVTYTQAGAQTISPAIYSILKLSGSGIKTLGGGTTTIPAGGTLEMSTTSTLISGGTLSVSSTGTTLIYSSSSNQNATDVEWNNNFENVIIRNVATVSMSGLSKTINGSLTLNSGIFNIGAGGSLTLNGTLVRTSGLIAGTTTSDLAISGITGGTVLLPLTSNISLRNVNISGNRTLKMNDSCKINLSGSFIIAAAATYDNGGDSSYIKANGGTPSITISGKFINRNKFHFTGTNGAIPGIPTTLNTGSTIEYALTGSQVVSARSDYDSITFSGSGTKTISNAFTPAGTVYITGSAIVDASGHNLGDGVTLTNLTMDGGRLIVGTSGTQPMMDGTYNLTGGVIEFAGTSAKTIRSPITYYAIEVSGTNVGNSLGNINLALDGLFTVKTGGKFTINDNQITGASGSQTVIIEAGGEFKCGNEDGFSGGGAGTTSLKNDINNISLAAGSIVNYTRVGDQTITNQQAYQNLAISGTGDKFAPSGVLIIAGDFNKTGTSSFIHNGGTVLFDGGNTIQNYTADSEITFNNITNNNIEVTTGLSINSPLSIEGVLTAGVNSNLILYGNITLKSNEFTTASVPEVPASAVINTFGGEFVVERYFTPKRAWRFLSVPTNTSQTIKQAWQEGADSASQNPVLGYGTQITDKVTPDAINGFDYYSPGGPSLKTYDAATETWVGITSTLDPIATTQGLMTFVRGDRLANNSSGPITPTTLRTAGPIYVGTLPVIPVPAGQAASIGNPYPSALDMREINKTDVDNTFYLWDPKLTGANGFGAYQTFILDGNDYYPIPGNGSYDSGFAYNYIQSGQAFFVRNSGGTNGFVTFTESAKASPDSPAVNNTLVFRPALAPPPKRPLLLPLLRTNLFSVDTTGTESLLDGVLNLFGNDFSNAIDKTDAVKAMNFYENLGIKNEGKLLSIERRKTINTFDTVQLNLTKLGVKQYRFVFKPANINQPDLTAFLEDSFMNTLTPIDLTSTTVYNFNVIDSQPSWNPTRFRILFIGAAGGPLPVTFTAVKAYQQNSNIQVEWNVENEKNMKEYIVEESGNGRHFTPANTIKAKGNNSSSTNYQWLDVNTVTGANYYRIRSINLNGEIQYSTVVNVILGKGKPQILVNPNPLVGATINLQLINQPKDIFNIKLLNTAGQVVSATIIKHEQGSSSETIQINKNLPAGMYLLKVSGKDKNETSIKILK